MTREGKATLQTCEGAVKQASPQEDERGDVVSTPVNLSTACNKQRKRKKKKKQGSSSASQEADTRLYGSEDKFNIIQHPNAGRCVVAAKDLEAGDVISREPPFSKVLFHVVYLK